MSLRKGKRWPHELWPRWWKDYFLKQLPGSPPPPYPCGGSRGSLAGVAFLKEWAGILIFNTPVYRQDGCLTVGLFRECGGSTAGHQLDRFGQARCDVWTQDSVSIGKHISMAEVQNHVSLLGCFKMFDANLIFRRKTSKLYSLNFAFKKEKNNRVIMHCFSYTLVLDQQNVPCWRSKGGKFGQNLERRSSGLLSSRFELRACDSKLR